MKHMARASEDVALRTAPLKALSRFVEKAAAAPSGASSIVDVVRCAFVCESKTAMARAFDALAHCEQLVIVRGEDRWANPTARGWADILLNVRLAGKRAASIKGGTRVDAGGLRPHRRDRQR
jgi:hypothetical protein